MPGSSVLDDVYVTYSKQKRIWVRDYLLPVLLADAIVAVASAVQTLNTHDCLGEKPHACWRNT